MGGRRRGRGQIGELEGELGTFHCFFTGSLFLSFIHPALSDSCSVPGAVNPRRVPQPEPALPRNH